MTVNDLIDSLRTLPGDAEIMACCDGVVRKLYGGIEAQVKIPVGSSTFGYERRPDGTYFTECEGDCTHHGLWTLVGYVLDCD